MSGETRGMSLGDQIKNGMLNEREIASLKLSPADQLRFGIVGKEQMKAWEGIQRNHTGTVTESKGVEQGGITVQFRDGTRGFSNLAELTDWCKENFGVVSKPDGSRYCGQTIEEMRRGNQQLN